MLHPWKDLFQLLSLLMLQLPSPMEWGLWELDLRGTSLAWNQRDWLSILLGFHLLDLTPVSTTFHATYLALCLQLVAPCCIQDHPSGWMEWCLLHLFPAPGPLLAHQRRLLGVVVQFHYITHSSQFTCKRALESFPSPLMVSSTMGRVIMIPTQTFFEGFNPDPQRWKHLWYLKMNFRESRLEDPVKVISVMDNQCWLIGYPSSSCGSMWSLTRHWNLVPAQLCLAAPMAASVIPRRYQLIQGIDCRKDAEQMNFDYNPVSKMCEAILALESYAHWGKLSGSCYGLQARYLWSRNRWLGFLQLSSYLIKTWPWYVLWCIAP